MILHLIEEFFETLKRNTSRKYMYPNAKRLFGYPVLSLITDTAPDWTAYGRVEGANEQP
jgi:hypothetical protein